MPIGCVPPACWPYRGGSIQPLGVCIQGSPAQPQGSAQPWEGLHPREVCPTWGGVCPTPGGSASRGVCPTPGESAQPWGDPGQIPFPLCTGWHTGVKTLPCPKLRLRAVITSRNIHLDIMVVYIYSTLLFVVTFASNLFDKHKLSLKYEEKSWKSEINRFSQPVIR